MKSNSPIVGRLVMVVVATLISLFSSFSVNSIFLPDSDTANNYFAALDMLRGNVFLHSWHLPPDGYWLLDIFGMSVFAKFLGPSSDIPFVLAAVWLAAIAGLAVFLSSGPQSQWRWQRALPAILFIGLVPLFLRTPVSYFVYAPCHIGTIAISLLGLMAAQSIIFNNRPYIGSFVLFFVSIVIFLSDSFGFFVFLFPLLIVGFFRFLCFSEEKRAFYFIALSVLLAFISSSVIKFYIKLNSGFVSAKLSPSFIPIEKIPEKTIYTIKSLLDFFGVDFLGPKEQFFFSLVRIVPFLCIIIFLKRKVFNFNNLRDNFMKYDCISQVIIVGAVIDFCAAFLSDFGVEKSDIIRYYAPVFIYSIILYARNVEKIHTFAFLFPCFVGVSICLAMWKHWGHDTARFVDIFHLGHQVDTREVNFILSQNNLTFGYGGYWDASVTTFNSDGKHRVRALKNTSLFSEKRSNEPDNKCTLSPYLWISKENWYYRSELGDATNIFFITHEGEDPHHTWIKHGDLVASLGYPVQHFVLRNGIFIDVYTRDVVENCRGLFIDGG